MFSTKFCYFLYWSHFSSISKKWSIAIKSYAEIPSLLPSISVWSPTLTTRQIQIYISVGASCKYSATQKHCNANVVVSTRIFHTLFSDKTYIFPHKKSKSKDDYCRCLTFTLFFVFPLLLTMLSSPIINRWFVCFQWKKNFFSFLKRTFYNIWKSQKNTLKFKQWFSTKKLLWKFLWNPAQ